MREKVKIAVLISGGGTNLQALLDAQKSGILENGEIAAVISNKADAYGLVRAEQAGVPHYTVVKEKARRLPDGRMDPADAAEKQRQFEAELLRILDEIGAELIVLAGFLAILSADFTKRFPERILNVHPSLIPSFCGQGFYGLKVHEAALAYGVKVTGATVHFVNEVPDGGRILRQKAVEVHDGDTPELLQRRVMEEAEWKLLPQAAEQVSAQIRAGREQKN